MFHSNKPKNKIQLSYEDDAKRNDLITLDLRKAELHHQFNVLDKAVYFPFDQPYQIQTLFMSKVIHALDNKQNAL